MSRWIVALLAVGFALTAPAAAFAEDKKVGKKEDKKDATLSSTWTRESEGFLITLDFAKEGTLLVIVKAEDRSVTLTSSYTVDKDGTVKAKTSKVESKNDFPVAPELKDGYTFSMKVKVDGKKATVTDFDAENAADGKHVVEGTYKLKEKEAK